MQTTIPGQLSDECKLGHESENEAADSISGESLNEGGQTLASRQEPEFIDAKAAASWLGVPLRSLYQYVRQGCLPSYKLGRHRLFRKQELFSALAISRIASRDEVLR
ncbi:MAG: hypothetical protein BGO12_05125 [Verrucomicrobia bacterium 61-8]|jgi:excisionase family DNA binding protein|nr:helix-turn-helix domain-containing protein [Verrucomicrobiota bacterium]OJV19423.1 MAG: hypothetical protein BGO12_05125 [Verrucomicrobia bacterium 61-8]